MEDNGTLCRPKLSKKILMELPTGVYIVSNCYKRIRPDKYVPAIEEEVVPFEQREAQWERIKAARANHRLCFVYTSFEDYERLKATWRST